jgi:chromosome segregation ATPase
MTYTRGKIAEQQKARRAVEQHQQEIEALYAEGRRLAQTAKQLRQRNVNLEAKIETERERLEASRRTLTATLAGIETAQAEADAAIREAEARAGLIAELAADQARALAERAYASGHDKGEDLARAKHRLLGHMAPAPMIRRIDRDHAPAEILATPPRGTEGLQAAYDEYRGRRAA